MEGVGEGKRMVEVGKVRRIEEVREGILDKRRERGKRKEEVGKVRMKEVGKGGGWRKY